MAGLIRTGATDPSVRSVALALVAALPSRDQVAQAQAIRTFVAGRLRFVRDPRGLELLGDPRYHIAEIRRSGYVQGDCDDAATLSGALAMAVGLPVRLVALGYTPAGPYTHVYTLVDVFDGSTFRAVGMDTTAADQVRATVEAQRILEMQIE